VVPTPAVRVDQVPCAGNQVLALYGAHFNPSVSSAVAGATQ